MKKETILVDHDEVLYGLIDAVITLLNNEYGYHLTKDNFKEWDLYNCIGKEAVDILHKNPKKLYEYGTINYKMINVIKELQKDYEIFIVTAAWVETIPYKYEWFEKHVPFIDQEHIIITRNKGMIKGDYLIDDGQHNIENFIQDDRIGILYTELSNERQYDDINNDRIIRINDTLDVLKFFKK